MSASISPGTRLGRFEVMSQIGAGGMGEVYLALDTELDRTVAIKILPPALALDQQRLQRFVQEAKAASALNHPHILTIYEIGTEGASRFIATEFIDGDTLRNHISAGVKLVEILEISIQVVGALVAAHAAGIIHRDIKPENIMVRQDGYIKLLDFGLAKLTERLGSITDTEALTKAMVNTDAGTVMGTANYMSPEQAKGTRIDARTDLWSLGAVIYEMVTGHVPFAGESPAETISLILQKEPAPLTRCSNEVPAELERIVNKTLTKNREERYQTARDLSLDLKSLKRRVEFDAELERSVTPDRPEPGWSSGQSSGQSSSRLSVSSLNAGTPKKASTQSGANRDALLLTEFTNSTGDVVFDGTLKMALAVTLEQSPFLEIFPESRVRQTLRLMGRAPDEILTRELGREICQRQGLKAYIAGTIASLGSVYVLTLEAVNAQTGDSLGRQLEQVESKEQVLKALGQAASGLREKLGESLSSIEQFAAPVELTTSSLEALKVFSLGFEQRLKGRNLEVIPFYKRAIELDPNFAYAYIELATIYDNTSQPQQAAEYVIRAYELRDRVSELEKLRLTVFYHTLVTGELDKAIETLDLYKQIYLRDERAFIHLSDIYIRIGRFEKAIDSAREALRLNSNNALNHVNLGESLLHLNRFAEARGVFEQASEQKLDNIWFHSYLYQIAFIADDTATMVNQLAWFSGQTNEYIAFNLQTGTAAFRGEWRKAQDFSRRAIDLASRSDAKGVAASYAAEQALRIVFWSSGTGLPNPNDDRLKLALKTHVQQALRLERNQITLSRAGFASSLAGQTVETRALTQELKSEYPKDTLIKNLYLPLAEAALELQNGQPEDAIASLEPAERFEPAGEFYPQYLRGLAYLKLNKGKPAAMEFKKIIAHRGEAPLSALYPLAQLGLARASLTDDVEQSLKAYEEFFALWKDADPDMPPLVAARAEFTRLA